MDHFNYLDGELFCEDVPLREIAAKVGTPTYVYSSATFLEHYKRIARAFAEVKPLICYSIVRLHADRSRRSIVIAAFAFAMPALAGHPETSHRLE